jgi:hypothetical protein
MKSGSFVKAMIFFALASGVVFTALLFLTNPDQGTGAKSLFLFTIFVLIFSIYALLAFLVKRSATNNEAGFMAMKSSLRQGILLGLFSIAALLLSAIGLLTWWDLLLLAFSLLLIELYFKSDKAREHSDVHNP